MAHCLRLGLGGSLGHRLQEKPEKPVERVVPLRALPVCKPTPSGLSQVQGEAQSEGTMSAGGPLLSAGEGWGSTQGVLMPGKEHLLPEFPGGSWEIPFPPNTLLSSNSSVYSASETNT